MKRVTARDIYEGYGEGDDEGYEDVEYVLASEAQERERMLHKVIRSALKSMENMCSYPEDHKLAIELIHATLAQVKGGEEDG